jgi:hypothetical protein
MSLLALLWAPLTAIVVDIPLLGSPLTPPILDELRDLKGGGLPTFGATEIQNN